MNDFDACYKLAEDGRNEPFWDAVYRKYFYNMTNHMVGKKEYCKSQIYGVDRVIYLENGKTITIDEKVRTEIYDDIVLEFISNDSTGTPGWMEKDLAIDYLAYAFLPNQTVYLFDWLALKRAWNHYKESWKKTYGVKQAKNIGYNTHFVCVPIKVLREACAASTIIVVNVPQPSIIPPPCNHIS